MVKLKCKTTTDNLYKLSEILVQVSSINKRTPSISLRLAFLEKSKLHIYGVLGAETVKGVAPLLFAYKDYVGKASSFFTQLDYENRWACIIPDIKIFSKLISALAEGEIDVIFSVNPHTNHAAQVEFIDSTGLSIKETFAEISEIPEIPLESANNKLNTESNFTLSLDKDLLTRIKSLISIRSNADEDILNDVVYIKIQDQKVYLGDSKWSLHMFDIEMDDDLFYFKKYLLGSHKGEQLDLHVYDTYIALKEDEIRSFYMLEIGG